MTKKRTTLKDLQRLANIANNLTGHELEPYTKGPNGTYKPNPGVFIIVGAYGGYCLDQMLDKGTGTRHILPGYVSPGVLADKLRAFISGLEAQQ